MMGNWQHREKKLAKRTRDKGMYKAYTQDIRGDKAGIKRKKRQDIQAKIQAQDTSLGDVDLEE